MKPFGIPQGGGRLAEGAAQGFSLVELLTVLAVVGMLVGLLVTALGGAKARTNRTTCLANLRQLNLGLRMYIEDSNDLAPFMQGTNNPTRPLTGYKQLMQSYTGFKSASFSQNSLYACPSDTFHYDDVSRIPKFKPSGFRDEPVSDFSSYAFNGGNATGIPGAKGLAGVKLASVRNPVRTVFLAEGSAFVPWSWHRPKRPLKNAGAIASGALNMISFVDGHADGEKIFRDGTRGSLAMQYDPPEGYRYQWSAD